MSAIDTGRRRFLRTAGAAAAAAGLSGGGFAVGRMSGTTTEAAGTPAPTGLPFAFRTGGYRAALDVPDGMQPWRTRTAERTDSGQHDAAGVRMFRAHGRLHDHPVGQIQYGLENLASHRRTGDTFFLRRARAQADRVIRRRHQARGAWFFPYPFDFSHAVHKGVTYRAPWYSGMAQGEALSLFSQLARNTGVPSADRAQYRNAADKAFASLLVGNDKGPWVVARDERDHLWIHEYPIDAPGTSDYTYNGFMFAALGLWDYYAMSRNPLAEQLFDGSLTTLHAYFPDLRNPGRLSHYCRTHEIPTVHYHPVHIDLLLQLSWLSGSERFAAHADLLMEDYPPPSLGASGGRVTLQDGTHTLFRFTDEGAVTATRRLHLRRPRQFTASRRTRVMGRGIHYLLTDGPEAEWYVAERFPAVRLHGEWCGTDYRPARRAVFQAGVSVICHASPTVNAAPRTVTYPKDTPVYYNRRALVEGRSMVRLTDGPSAGWWAPTAQLLMPGAL
ncbi:D-glucuronyl C5-epimerase family protein [Streptomyces sp. NPDC002668]|uniref:D-glucuronyl C5-epimerase family protein n=1 Tax=Streptomyces sp. NPDC002668 TaxID=3154422 RepID=UPI003320AC60